MHRAVTLPMGRSRSHLQQEEAWEQTPTVEQQKVCTCGHDASPTQCGGLGTNPHPTEKRILCALLLFFRGRSEHGVFSKCR